MQKMQSFVFMFGAVDKVLCLNQALHLRQKDFTFAFDFSVWFNRVYSVTDCSRAHHHKDSRLNPKT